MTFATKEVVGKKVVLLLAPLQERISIDESGFRVRPYSWTDCSWQVVLGVASDTQVGDRDCADVGREIDQ